MQAAITAHNLVKRFGAGRHQSVILHGVSLEVERGETVFLVGPSGSGKTTLLSILGCILTPDGGSIRVLGQDVAQLRGADLTTFRREQLGFIFQSFHLFPTLSALDNVRLGLTMRGLTLTEATRRARGLLDQVHLGPRAGLRPGQLSTGECQRVALARALANAPRVLFADEPTASLDADNGRACMELLACLVRERGTTLVVVTHDSRIYPFADRIVRLEDGRIAADSTSAGLPATSVPAERQEFVA